MGIFTDYLSSYGDLKNAFNNAREAGGLYVDLNPDIAEYWHANQGNEDFRAMFPTKGSYGSWHYRNLGESEGRTMQYHTEVDDPSIGNVYWELYVESNPEVQQAWQNAGSPADRRTFGANYWETQGRNKGHKVPTRVGGAEGWGQAHWATYGSKEDRILPGTKLSVDSGGNVYVANPNLIGAGARKYYDGLVSSVNNAPKGTYKYLMEGMANALGGQKFSDLLNFGGIDVINAGYQKKKVSPWDARSQGAQPPTGGFDSNYYRLHTNGGKVALQEWNNALSSVRVGPYSLPDLDVTGSFNRDSYLHWYYTTRGKAAGDRGNPEVLADIADKYTESFTDADYQMYRDQVLGLSDRFDSLSEWAQAQDPKVLKEWYSKLTSEEKKLYDSGELPVPTQDDIPDSLRDKIVMDKGTTLLEGELSPLLGQKEKQQQQMFGALTNDSLKAAARELQKVKAQESRFDFYKNMEGFDEIISVNESIANSILGDSGFGGMLGFMTNPSQAKESLGKALESATGIRSRNSTIYNWQNWFENELVKRYEDQDLTVVDPLDPNVTYKIDAEFAKDYIERYLKPRFDTSRSMTEFISYMDVKQNEQNIFQTQSALDALRDIADVRAKAYLDKLKTGSPLNFNADFYFNPTGNFSEDDPKLEKYNQQKQQVQQDWNTARTSPSSVVAGTNWTWDQWAYHYGLNVNDPEQFAKLHYQVKGAAAGYDPAKDVITLKDAEDYIQQTILPEIMDEKLNIGDVSFLNFVTPEEYADNLLKGINPTETPEEWNKLLETMGLSGKDLGTEEIKQYIIEAFQTNEAKKIRQSIKYLNEKKLTPTQEKLGTEYIERPEDVKTVSGENETKLYKIFKDAGYQGSEDDFYDTFMTDVNRSEMELLTQGTSGIKTGTGYAELTSSDPFESMFAIDKLFGNVETEPVKQTKDTGYFTLLKDEDTSAYKSKSGKKILDEFTSLFKGFS